MIFFLCSHFFESTQSFLIFGQAIENLRQKDKILRSFQIFGYNICSVVHEANTTYMVSVWCIRNVYTQNIYLANLIQKFKIVTLRCNLVPTIMDKIFSCTTGKLQSLFFRIFLLVLTKFSFRKED